MAGERGKLTDHQIRHRVKASVPLAKADGGGLRFTPSAGGSAGCILRYSFGGRRRELTIGRYPDIGLAEARGIATLKRAEVQQGRNPAAEMQKAKATAARDWTVRGESNMLHITTKCLFTHGCGKRPINANPCHCAPPSGVLPPANRTRIDGDNYARSEPPGLVRVGDALWLAAGIVGMTAWLGDAGMVLFVPVAAVVWVGVAAVGWAARQRLARRVDR